jgi:hypothetical protein
MVTQQNAALVEESAAAAESLKVQALQLVQTMAVFKPAQGGARCRARRIPRDPSRRPRQRWRAIPSSAVGLIVRGT